jgi:hypothetical protein
MPVILATQEAEIKRILVQSQPRQIVHKTLSQKTFTKIGLLEWLKVEALSSSPVPPKKKKKKKEIKDDTDSLDSSTGVGKLWWKQLKIYHMTQQYCF